ncbi:MAG: cysteine--tRNA ligase [Candidatus Gracilibacteria bacterium]|nr:cysteine--tRNA ligase [Candidatus Gracilibacteria bacterium]
MQIYNTLTRKLEKFKPLRQEEVKVYYCGPTPYNYAHIGNLKTYIYEDYVIKSLKFLGYKIKTTMNITDIDDKTIRDSQKNGMTLLNFTQKYSQIFLEDLKKLNITLADNVVPISTLIDEMVEMINKLILRGYAYFGDDGSIYYEIKKFKKYGNLAHLDFSGMKESVRINNDEYDKENAADFVLWKAWKSEDGENFWEKEFIFGEKKVILKGRPGWHIECSACNMKYFGAQIDIHMGGVDNIFPHHENEIAQSEAYSGKTFSKYWIHGGHITVDGKKMSKSANNFYTLKDLEEKFSNISKSFLYRSIRLSFMNAKYRESVDFSFEKLEQNFNTIKKIDETLKKLNRVIKSGILGEVKVRRDFREELQDFIGEYVEKIEDDFNMPEALSIFFAFTTFVNTQIDSSKLSISEANSLMEMFKTFDSVLSILDFNILKSEEIPEDILEKFEARNEAKKDKNFTLADSLRDELLSFGYKIIDDRSGSRVERI